MRHTLTGGPGTSSPGQMSYLNASLRELMLYAFQPKPFQMEIPSWMDDEFFDVVAKVPPDAKTADVPGMWRSLLRERFGLRTRHETRVLAGFSLQVGKDGINTANLKQSARLSEAFPEQPVNKIKFSLDKDGYLVFPPGYAHMMTMHATDQQPLERLTAARRDMASLADYIAVHLRVPVRDDTGLTGLFDFHLGYLPDISADLASQSPIEAQPGPTLPQALNRWLGLVLEPKRLPVQMFIIDHIEKSPTDN